MRRQQPLAWGPQGLCSKEPFTKFRSPDGDCLWASHWPKKWLHIGPWMGLEVHPFSAVLWLQSNGWKPLCHGAFPLRWHFVWARNPIIGVPGPDRCSSIGTWPPRQGFGCGLMQAWSNTRNFFFAPTTSMPLPTVLKLAGWQPIGQRFNWVVAGRALFLGPSNGVPTTSLFRGGWSRITSFHSQPFDRENTALGLLTMP